MEFDYVEILHHLGDHVYVIPCAFCARRGHSPKAMRGWHVYEWSHLVECPVCDGRGTLEIESSDLLIYDAYCNGTGHEPHEMLEEGLPNVRCHKCGGVGVRVMHGQIRLLSSTESDRAIK